MQVLTWGVQKKAAKVALAEVVKDLKKADKPTDSFDAAASDFIVWHGKAPKAIGLEMGHMDTQIVSTLKYAPA